MANELDKFAEALGRMEGTILGLRRLLKAHLPAHVSLWPKSEKSSLDPRFQLPASLLGNRHPIQASPSGILLSLGF